MTRILHDRIQSLHLNPESPYPSEVRDAHELILQWRSSQRLRSVRCDSDLRDRDSIVVFGDMDSGEIA